MAGLSDAAADLFYLALTGKTQWTATDMFCTPVITAPSNDAGLGIAYTTGFADDDLVLPNANWTVGANGAGSYTPTLDFGAHTGAITIVGLAWHTADLQGGTYLGFEPLAVDAVLASGNSFQVDGGTMTIDLNANTGQATLSNAACQAAYLALTGQANWTIVDRHMALLTAEPTNYEDWDAGAGTEVTGGSYARIPMTNANWPAPTAGSGTYDTDVVYVTATANWGNVQGVAIIDSLAGAISSTNFFGYVDLSNQPQTVNNGGDFKINASTLTLDCGAG